jgi:hypothetical protein
MKLIHVNGNSLIASHTIWSICSLQDCNKSVTFLGSVNIGAITSTMNILLYLIHSSLKQQLMFLGLVLVRTSLFFVFDVSGSTDKHNMWTKQVS